MQLRRVLQYLPLANLVVLVWLLGFLSRVGRHSPSNRMPPANLAIVFAPNLLRHENESVGIVIEDSAQTVVLVTLLIENYDEIFAEHERRLASVLSGSTTLESPLSTSSDWQLADSGSIAAGDASALSEGSGDYAGDGAESGEAAESDVSAASSDDGGGSRRLSAGDAGDDFEDDDDDDLRVAPGGGGGSSKLAGRFSRLRAQTVGKLKAGKKKISRAVDKIRKDQSSPAPAPSAAVSPAPPSASPPPPPQPQPQPVLQRGRSVTAAYEQQQQRWPTPVQEDTSSSSSSSSSSSNTTTSTPPSAARPRPPLPPVPAFRSAGRIVSSPPIVSSSFPAAPASLHHHDRPQLETFSPLSSPMRSLSIDSSAPQPPAVAPAPVAAAAPVPASAPARPHQRQFSHGNPFASLLDDETSSTNADGDFRSGVPRKPPPARPLPARPDNQHVSSSSSSHAQQLPYSALPLSKSDSFISFDPEPAPDATCAGGLNDHRAAFNSSTTIVDFAWDNG